MASKGGLFIGAVFCGISVVAIVGYFQVIRDCTAHPSDYCSYSPILCIISAIIFGLLGAYLIIKNSQILKDALKGYPGEFNRGEMIVRTQKQAKISEGKTDIRVCFLIFLMIVAVIFLIIFLSEFFQGNSSAYVLGIISLLVFLLWSALFAEYMFHKQKN